MKVDLKDHARIAPNAMFQVVESESVILDLDSEQYFGLDEIGTRILQLVSEYGGLAEVCARMLDEYDVPARVLEQDVRDLVNALSERGLVVVDDGADGPASNVHGV